MTDEEARRESPGLLKLATAVSMVDGRQCDMLVHGDVEDPSDRYGDHLATLLSSLPARSMCEGSEWQLTSNKVNS